ncbi:MAG: pyruvate dehydrogenase [SAR202 cluster bacterium]|nr:pyruvate dehydrogenase [SAR202 cluster bacterium]
MATVKSIPDITSIEQRQKLLEEIQERVLWLAINMVDYANNVRPNPGGVKVGGHQASSSSVVTLMTHLYFEFMKAGDKISVKPHASPVFHAIQYLLGNLTEEHLKGLRAFHGLQAYPSRTKDPDGVDFSTGSVGLGAVAPNFAWLTEEYVRHHLNKESGVDRRWIALVGDAELDEGNVWEAIADPALFDSKNILWIVDLNRQSLDRIIPGIRVRCWRDMFAANGWRVVDAKYGKKLQAAFNEPNGELLRTAIDEMSNEFYQRLLRVQPSTLREWLPKASRYPRDMERLLGRWNDHDLQDMFRNLGGHDFGMLREAFDQMDLSKGPHVLFAYTLKGWKLPTAGDPQNHSTNLKPYQMEKTRIALGIPEDQKMARLPADSPAGKLCIETAEKLQITKRLKPVTPEMSIPAGFEQAYKGKMSTQQIFGLVLTEISRRVPELAQRLVTISPDVASSTNLGGWINKAGVWSRFPHQELPQDEELRALQWTESPTGQHIELGISENNLFMALGQLGTSFEMNGEMLFPLGTLYDPFVRRGLDAFYYAAYSGGKFIVVATPSGITLGPEGGAHQSEITPSIGVEMPEMDFYEPAFGHELEWIMLSAMEQIRRREHSTYLRLTSKRIDQDIFKMPSTPEAVETLRKQVIRGAYKLIDRSAEPGYGKGYNIVNIMAVGAMAPEAVAASNRLLDEGVFANVFNVTGPGPLYREFQDSVRAAIKEGRGSRPFLADVIGVGERTAPIVTVCDGHPHQLAWLGAALKTETYPLGVTKFGQSGNPWDLYREYGIDADSIMAASFSALGM